jgi:hypothetical protein
MNTYERLILRLLLAILQRLFGGSYDGATQKELSLWQDGMDFDRKTPKM